MKTTMPAVTLGALLALLLLLSACGSDDGTTEAGSSPGEADGETSTDSGDDDPTDDAGPGTDGQAGGDAPTDTTTDTSPPLGAGPYPVATLEITITHPDADTLRYTVTCLGDTATLTPAVAGLSEQVACERLADPEAQALLIDGPPQDLICTQVYGGPDEAAVTGTIDDRPVDTVIDRTDGCGIAHWDTVLAGVLPPARDAS